MNDSWDERRRALEDGYFDKANQAAMERLARRAQPKRLSPVTGKPMDQVTVLGVAIDRCGESGGIWLDAGELQQIVDAAKGSEASATGFVELLEASIQTEKRASGGALKSPISGSTMTDVVVNGVTVHQCPESGGVWLYPSDLRQLVAAGTDSIGHSIWDFFVNVLARKPL